MGEKTTNSQSLGKGGFLPDTFLEEVDLFLEDTESDDDSAECDPVSQLIPSVPLSSTTVEAFSSPSLSRQSIEKLSDTRTSPAVAPRPAKSVLKKTSSYHGLTELGDDEEVIPIRTEKSAWKTLPAPRTSPVRRRISSPNLEGEEYSCDGLKRNVSFNEIIIRDYEMTIGCNPSCADGVPVGLDWRYQELAPLPVDAYEEHRKTHRRNRQEMRLGPVIRRDIVREAGVSRGEIKQVQKATAKTRRERAATLSKLSWMTMEALIESATRKMKRGLGKTMGRSKSSDSLWHMS